MSWSAKQYVAFEDERTRPVRDLLAALPKIEARTVVDIGCGPGNSTAVLGARYPEATLMGFDSSPDMIEAARRRLPNAHFMVQHLSAWHDPGPFDVLLANAVLQWVPNHVAVLPNLISRLKSGGALALQMPDNLDEPAHRLMVQVAEQGPWAAKLAAATSAREPLANAPWYFDLLRRHCASVEVWRTTYYHRLAGGAAAIVEWFKGTGLRPFLEPLDFAERSAYLERYTAGIAAAHRTLADGSVLLPFPRLFVIALR